MRYALMGYAAAVLIGLSACSPIPRVLDTPKDGDAVALSVQQPMQVRWANPTPDVGAWRLEQGPVNAAVVVVGHKSEQPEGGAMALDIFDFEGAKEGNDDLTFAYQRKDGTPPGPEERITISVGVD